MSRYRSWQYPRYVTVGEKRAKAERKLKQLKKKNPRIQPIVIEGRALATTWWGKAWNTNLERYADYSNRIGRGRSYVRHRAVLDLQITPGHISALVQGSRAKPYKVDIRITGLAKKSWKAINQACAGQLDSLQDLLAGKFPQSLANLFTAKGKGLFPTPAQIKFDCSCPDWAVMCKHVAATLYGIGARLDEDPALFFKLRKVDIADLVDETVQTVTENLLEKADQTQKGVIADADLANVFGIDMEAPLEVTPAPRPPANPADEAQTVLACIDQTKNAISVPEIHAQTKVPLQRIRYLTAQALRKGRIERVARGRYRKTPVAMPLAEESKVILALIRKSPRGISSRDIRAKTKISANRLGQIVTRAIRKGRIERIARGVYAPPKRARQSLSINDYLLDFIRAFPKGVSVAQIKSETGLFSQQVSNVLYRLKNAGKIIRLRRGVYKA